MRKATKDACRYGEEAHIEEGKNPEDMLEDGMEWCTDRE